MLLKQELFAHVIRRLGAIFATDDQLVIRYAAQMTLDMKATYNVFDTLRQRFDTTQLVELTSTIATCNIVPRLLMTLRVSPEE